jgi:hypothetical protein
MKSRFWIVILAVILTSCNLTAIQTTATSPSTLIPVSPTSDPSTPTVVPIETLLARDTPTIVPTATSSITLASPRDQPVNCRFGPNVSYSIIGFLVAGRQAEVIGKSIDETWWYVRNPSDPSTNCWLSAEFTLIDGDMVLLPVVSPPEIGVTNIQVQVDPVLMNVGCDAFPQTVTISAQITANGPTIITWKWETSAGGEFVEETLLFESEGKKEVRDILTVWSANDYWVNMHVLLPNDRSGGANFKVTCVP